MEKVVLYELERPDIKIFMGIYFNEQGQLIFDGQDIGKSVEEYWGDSDYEYSYTIEPKEVDKLFSLFETIRTDKNTLLLEIKKRFEGNLAYTKFGEFLRNNNIDFTAFTWA